MRSTASLLFTTVKRVELEGTKRGAGPLTTGRRLGLVVVRPVALITKATHSQTQRERERERDSVYGILRSGFLLLPL